MINDVSKKIEEHRKEIKRITMTPRELSEELGIGLNKALELTRTENFPCLKNGNRILIIRSKVEQFLEENVGLIF